MAVLRREVGAAENALPSGVRKTVIGQPPLPVSICTASMYTASRSGRSSRSTLMLTKPSFIRAAMVSFSKDSRSMTWHQWQAEYPMLSRMGLSSALARARASSPHGYQSTGFWACCNR